MSNSSSVSSAGPFKPFPNVRRLSSERWQEYALPHHRGYPLATMARALQLSLARRRPRGAQRLDAPLEEGRSSAGEGLLVAC